MERSSKTQRDNFYKRMQPAQHGCFAYCIPLLQKGTREDTRWDLWDLKVIRHSIFNSKICRKCTSTNMYVLKMCNDLQTFIKPQAHLLFAKKVTRFNVITYVSNHLKRDKTILAQLCKNYYFFQIYIYHANLYETALQHAKFTFE